MKYFANKNGGWIIIIVTLIGINILASLFHKRIDLTNEKRFTISAPVKNLLKKINEKVTVYIFLTGDIPSGFKKLSAASTDLLQEFNEYADGNIDYKIISADEKIPGSDKTFADTLSSLGIIPINLKVQLKDGEQSQYIFPAALAKYKNQLQAINLYPGTMAIITPPELNNAEALLEYKFANAIEKLIVNRKPLVAYSIGNGEPTGANTYGLIENVLTKNYSLFTINLHTEPIIPDTFQLLLIVKPTQPFSAEEKFKIDQYIMRGGKVLFFIDRLEAEMDSLQIKNQVIAYDRNLQLTDLFFNYGVRINPDLIMDLQSDYLPFSVNNNDQFEFLKWNYFPLFESKQNSVINKNLGLVAGRFVNSIDTVGAEGIQKTILLSSSANSRTIEAPALISGEENRNAPIDEAYTKKDIPVAVLLEGKFNSLYKNRVSQAQMDSLKYYGNTFISENMENNKMIVVSDGDIPLNATIKGELLPMGINPYTVGTQYEYQFANKQFVENSIEYLINDAGLSEAKSKNYTLRLLDSQKVKENKGFWQIINFGIPIILITLLGIIYQYWRKRKYASAKNG